jgi:hypothetical protein
VNEVVDVSTPVPLTGVVVLIVKSPTQLFFRITNSGVVNFTVSEMPQVRGSGCL